MEILNWIVCIEVAQTELWNAYVTKSCDNILIIWLNFLKSYIVLNAIVMQISFAQFLNTFLVYLKIPKQFFLLNLIFIKVHAQILN